MSVASDLRWLRTLEDYVLTMAAESQDWRVRQLVYAAARQVRNHRARRNSLRKARRSAREAGGKVGARPGRYARARRVRRVR